jgi:uncharacterized membrane-anchored protein
LRVLGFRVKREEERKEGRGSAMREGEREEGPESAKRDRNQSWRVRIGIEGYI